MTTRGRANIPWQTVHKPQTKEKQSNQLPLPHQGDHNARQDPLNTTISQRTGQNMKKLHGAVRNLAAFFCTLSSCSWRPTLWGSQIWRAYSKTGHTITYYLTYFFDISGMLWYISVERHQCSDCPLSICSHTASKEISDSMQNSMSPSVLKQTSTYAEVRHTQLAFYINLQRAVGGPSATLTGR